MFSLLCPCRASAEEAIQKMQGKIIGQQVVRTSWGRNPAAKQVFDLPIAVQNKYFPRFS